MRVLLAVACSTLLVLPSAAFARGRQPQNPTPPRMEQPENKQMKCVAACQDPAEKCLTKCGKSVSCMERCTKDLQQCTENCGVPTGGEEEE